MAQGVLCKTSNVHTCLQSMWMLEWSTNKIERFSTKLQKIRQKRFKGDERRQEKSKKKKLKKKERKIVRWSINISSNNSTERSIPRIELIFNFSLDSIETYQKLQWKRTELYAFIKLHQIVMQIISIRNLCKAHICLSEGQLSFSPTCRELPEIFLRNMFGKICTVTTVQLWHDQDVRLLFVNRVLSHFRNYFVHSFDESWRFSHALPTFTHIFQVLSLSVQNVSVSLSLSVYVWVLRVCARESCSS